MECRRHVLLVTLPAQGHINPSLQFARKLIKMGIEVTFATSVYARRRMVETTAGDATPKGLNFVAFSNGFDDGFRINTDDAQKSMTEMRRQGPKTLKDTILAAEEKGRPITCLVYSILLPWASEVARECQIPCALLWIQPATVLDIYYYYFHGFGDEIIAASSDPSKKFNLPKTPLMLSKRDLPSFLVPATSDKYYALPTFKEQLDTLDSETNPKVLVNTFEALEVDALKTMDKYELIAVGPLIRDPFDNSFIKGDLFQESHDDYMEWLNSRPKSSVVYVSFGSLLNHSKAQMEEIAKGLLECCRPFLWVIRGEDDNEKLSYLEELKKVGKIVSWCSQLKVLTNPSLGCFVMHCGWNSTLESISCGVPVVAFPHWSDQGTTAKLIEDVWRIGVRVSVNEEDGIVKSGEIRRCIEEVMDGGEKSRELRENTKKWKCLAREAMEENGSSTKSLKVFLEEVDGGC